MTESDVRLCACCGSAYTYETGKSPRMCDPCYTESCHPQLRECRAGRRDARVPEVTEESQTGEWRREWNEKVGKPLGDN